jgi:pyridoxal phosphate enzyme (YggS family)
VENERDTDLIVEQVHLIRTRIRQAAVRVGRAPEVIHMIAATKSVTTSRIRAAMSAGVTEFGENKLQEALPKLEVLGWQSGLTWHFLGHLQRRKVKSVVGRFQLIHSVDSVDLAREINQRAEQSGVRQSILLEVNIGKELSKTGFMAQDLPQALPLLDGMRHLEVKGLMAIPPATEVAEDARPYFRAVRLLADSLKRSGLSRIAMGELSMGMSQDFEIAVEEGATYVRIGTAIFGARPFVGAQRDG